MPEIYITTQTLQKMSQDITQQISFFQGFIKGIDNAVASLRGGWKGDAQKAFDKSWGETKGLYDQFVKNDLPKFSQFLEKYLASMSGIDSGTNFNR